MNRVLAKEVRSLVLAHLETPLAANGLHPRDVPDDFDLLTGGVIDSLGFVELLAAVEQHFGIQIDFEDLDPENLTVIGPFCRYIEEKSSGATGREAMMTFRSLYEDSDRERFIPEVLPWIHEAGNPYFDWVFGGRAAALKTIATWMRRPSSEISISRVVLLFDGDRPVGGFIALGGADLALCRKADALAMLKEADSQGRSDLRLRMAGVRDLFLRVGTEEFYLSKTGVAVDLRSTGLGRRLAVEYLATGRAAGFRRFRLDVWAENRTARQLYESLGFRVVRESASAEAGMKYLSMVREQDAE
ncbi:MAG: GNAT family N-acetyltransferase [Acidobacteriota bacterium]